MTQFKSGDKVYLKSGSPAMTVIVVDPGGGVHVAWSAPHGGPMMRDLFPSDCLTDKKPYSPGSPQ